ncbi:MAG: hypothetical protein K1X94_07535 [Sandaracinaceae bacterium]|nr:hypothetical protein [Sandaracinaceae bacterium]
MDQLEDNGGAPDDSSVREQLAHVLLGGFVHDIGSPLAALTSNLSVAKELAETDDEPSRNELKEVLEDLEMATKRLTELASDLRGYVGLPVGTGSFEDLARASLRLARSHLSRRANVELKIDPALRPTAPSAVVLRAVGELVVAVTRELGPGARQHQLSLRTVADGFTLEVAPPPPGNVARAVRVATARLGSEATVTSTPERLEVRVPLAWAT